MIKIKKHKRVGNVLKNGSDLKKLLLNETSFLTHDASNNERLYYVEHNIKEQVCCPTCNNPTKISRNKILFCSVSCSKNYIPNENGKSVGKIAAIKTKKKLSHIDSKTGKTGYQKIGSKISKTLNSINLDTGLTYGQEIGIKTSKTLNSINPDTGLTYGQEIRRKSNDLRKTIINGKSLNEIYLKNAHEKNRNSFLENLNLFFEKSEYTLLTNKPYKYSLLKYQCEKCNSTRESYWPYIRCTNCYPYNKSISEHEILEFCQSFTNDVISNDRNIISPLELDIYIPNHNLAIEFNGLYWHSSDSVDNENKDYHLTKTNLCKEQDIQLLHIFENEWADPIKQNIWKSIIRNKLGLSERIYARKCNIVNVDTKTKTEFLNQNHLQSNCSSSVNIGLEYNGELVSLMTFGKSRFSKKYDWELLRFCNKKNYSVIGGAGRLLKHFKKYQIGRSIISYADLRRSDGNLYKNLGFELSHESEPNYWYYKDSMNLESRIKYQKHKLSKLLENYDSELSESENMYQNGYRKIYDCGNQVWINI